MKKQFLIAALLGGMAVSAYSQGTILIDNSVNFFGGADQNATTGGLFFTLNQGVYTLTTGDLNIVVLTSSTETGTYTPNISIIGTPDYGGLDGTVSVPERTLTGYAVSGSVWLKLQTWVGTAPDYATAQANGAFAGTSAAFQVSGLGGQPASGPYITAPGLDVMPSVVLQAIPVPEPGTFALAGIGAAALLIFRRRK